MRTNLPRLFGVVSARLRKTPALHPLRRTALPDEQGTGRMTVSYEHRPESRKIVVAAQGYRPDRLSRAFSGRLAQ